MTNATNISGRRKIGRSIALEAGKALYKDKTVFLLPMFSFIAHIAVCSIAALAWILSIPFMDTNPNGTSIVNTAIGILLVFAFGLINVFTQAAVMNMANETFEGRNPSINSSIASALKHTGSLAGLAAIETTVGLILRALQRSAGNNLILRAITSIVSFVGGLAWAVASYFAIPLIIFSEEKPFTAIKKSAQLIKSKWGAALRVNVLVGALVTLGLIASFFGIFGGIYTLTQGFGNNSDLQNQLLISSGITIIAVSVLFFIALVLINSTLMAYVRVALFRYATNQALPGFDTSNLDQAFITSKVSRFGLGTSN